MDERVIKRQRWSGIVLVLIGYMFLALAYSAVNPLFESPDEVYHYEFVRYVIEHRALPVQTPGKLSEFHQPPLYYVLTALAIGGVSAEPFVPQTNPFWGYDAYRFGVDNKAQFAHPGAESFPYQGTFLAAHLARVFSIALGALSVLVCYLILLNVFQRSLAALGALAFVAFNPQFLFISSSISNDNLITLLGVLIAWLSIRTACRGLTLRRTFMLAVLVALAILTKLSAAILAVVPLLVIITSPTTWRRRVGALALLALVVAAITGGWFWRNYQLYGDWTGIQMWQQIWGWQTAVNDWSKLGIVLRSIWTSFWGQFGLGQIVLPDWLYLLLLVMNLLSLLGVALYLFRARHRSEKPAAIQPRAALIVGCLLAAMIAASIWYGLTNPTGAAGRFLLPAIAPIAALLFWGWRSLYRPDRPELDRWFVVLSYVVMLGLSVAVLVGVITPAYAAPPSLSLETVRAQTQPVNIQFGDAAQLIGYRLKRGSVTKGEELTVTLCWRPLKTTTSNLYFFLHLLGPHNAIVARRESWPGLGRYPTTQWQPGRIFCDTVPLQVAANVVAPQVYDLEIGLVDPTTKSRLPPVNEAGATLKPAILTQVKVRGAQPPTIEAIPAPDAIELGGQIRLQNSTVAPASMMAGQSVTVTLMWSAVNVPTSDYTVFVHLRDAAGNIVTQADSPPQGGTYPTHFWDAGETVADVHTVQIPANLAAGDYTLVVGLYRLDTGERLPITRGGSGSEITLPFTLHLQ